jgi:hypothetical protein
MIFQERLTAWPKTTDASHEEACRSCADSALVERIAELAGETNGHFELTAGLLWKRPFRAREIAAGDGSRSIRVAGNRHTGAGTSCSELLKYQLSKMFILSRLELLIE